MHQNKGKTVARSIKDRIDYAINSHKTEDGKYVSCYECDPKTAAGEFVLSKRMYEDLTGRKQKNSVLAYQIRHAFKPGEVSPEQANEIGYKLGMSFTKGKYAFVVATHVDKEHIHNHIIFNSVSLDNKKKFRNFFGSAFALRRLSDQLSLEYGLSIIESPKFSRGSYENWAKVFNVKQMANTINFLREHDCFTYEELAQKATQVTNKFYDINASIKQYEKKIEENKTIQNHIFNYSKTRDIFIAYRKSGYSKKFYQEHEKEIILHKSAKDYFNSLETKTIPRINKLREEYSTLVAEKQAKYKEYKELKK